MPRHGGRTREVTPMYTLFPAQLTLAWERAAYLFLLLMFYSFAGWCGEMVYCSIGQRKLCEKRGFLNGPICPIYGHGALVVLIVLRGGCESPVATFFLGALLTSAVEYITSYAMEKLFHMRWWDYSRYRFQLNGRICLLNSSLFGLASVVLCHGIGPAVSEGVLRLFAAGAALPLAAVLAVLYVSDIVVSVRSAIQIGQRLEKLHAVHDELAAKLDALKEESRQAMLDQREKLGTSLTSARQTASEKAGRAAQVLHARLEPLGELGDALNGRLDAAKAEAQQKLQRLYDGQGFFERRLLRSYPALRSPKHGDALKKLREHLESRKK